MQVLLMLRALSLGTCVSSNVIRIDSGGKRKDVNFSARAEASKDQSCNLLGISLAVAISIRLTAFPAGAWLNDGKAAPVPGCILSRHYEEGEKLTYHITGSNQEWHYAIDANGLVKKDASGKFYEEYEWTGMISDNTAYSLPEAIQKFRQTVTLEPDVPPSVLDLSCVDSKIIGPITDFLTIYSDLWLADKIGVFLKAGDHSYFKRGTPNSWADGN